MLMAAAIIEISMRSGYGIFKNTLGLENSILLGGLAGIVLGPSIVKFLKIIHGKSDTNVSNVAAGSANG